MTRCSKQFKGILPNKETIEFPQYNFKVELNYGNLNEYQMWRAKQEIKNTVYNFKEEFGLNKSDKVLKWKMFLFDTGEDYVNYTESKGTLGHTDGTYSYTFLKT